MNDLSGKVAIVTGGGQGLGRGIAMALAKAGARVAIFGRTEASLLSSVNAIKQAGGDAFFVVGDLKNQADRELLVAETVNGFGTIDILVNNAMEIPHGTLLDIEDEVIEAAWQSGPIAALKLMRLCHPYLSGGGAIVNISGGVAVASNVPHRGIYAAVKAALNAISRAAANEWAGDRIRVNSIMPYADSPALQAFFKNEPENAATVLSQVPLGRAGDAETEVGKAVAFLASDDAQFITGVTLPVDGGIAYVR